MKARHLLMAILCICFAQNELKAQLGFSHEVGVIAGPVAFQSDFGLRNDFDTNRGNIGFGVGIVHYLNFAYRADCNCYSRDTYFNDHFKVRNEIDYHITNLEHFGELADDDNFGGELLRAHDGKAKVLEIGTQLEYFPMSIRDFSAGAYRVAPYVSVGVHFVSFDPEATSSLAVNGDLNTSILYQGGYSNPYNNNSPEGPPFLPAFGQGDGKYGGIDDRPGSTWAITWSAGIRYKLGILSDLVVDARWHYYTSNWVDGLNPDENAYPANRANDWIFWLNVGYIYYLD